MTTFLKIFGGIFGILAIPMLFIFLYRMNNGNFTFIGISDLFEYVSKLDWTSNFWKMINEMQEAVNAFGAEFGKTYNNDWEAFSNGFMSFTNMIWIAPFRMMYDFCMWLYDIVNNIVGFFDFVVKFQGI